ncbi:MULTISPECIES: hypothetical protein [Nostocales]|uniref:Uncharacterized protein n=3 Tax=Nostocales TaxID=1161 RepID=A0A8S9SXD2_9CYAN|nr:hypothetical protein [Tolypothrix bouteillei]KAF3883933.1 hypothetical protein DA73_0400040245 [Tolypothrix bouteillei VB521301]
MSISNSPEESAKNKIENTIFQMAIAAILRATSARVFSRFSDNFQETRAKKPVK